MRSDTAETPQKSGDRKSPGSGTAEGPQKTDNQESPAADTAETPQKKADFTATGGRLPAGSRGGLTEARARNARPIPGKRETTLRDSGSYRGLELRITEAGVKTFSFVYRRASDGQRQRYKLGRYGAMPGEMSLDDARTEMTRVKAKAIDGDPQGARRAAKAAKTVGELYQHWQSEARTDATAWNHKVRLLYEKYIEPARVDGVSVIALKVRDLRRAHVMALLERCRKTAAEAADGNGNATRNQLASVIGSMVGFAVDSDQYGIEFSVAARLKRLPTGNRKAYVRRDELGIFWNKVGELEDIDFREALHAIILSAQRNAQIRSLDWAWVNWDKRVIYFPGSIMKAKRSHVLGIAPMLYALLKARHERQNKPVSGLAFRGRRDPRLPLAYPTTEANHKRIAKALGMKVAMHDWRRSFSNLTKEEGVSREDRGRVLSHVDASMTEQHYTDDDGYPNETRAALAIWESIISVAVNATDGGNVVSLSAGTAG